MAAPPFPAPRLGQQTLGGASDAESRQQRPHGHDQPCLHGLSRVPVHTLCVCDWPCGLGGMLSSHQPTTGRSFYVYVCMHMFVHVCIAVCICVHACLCVYARVHAHTCACVFMHASVLVCTHVFVHVCTGVHVGMHVCACTCACTQCVHVCLCVFGYWCVCMCVCVCMHVCVRMCVRTRVVENLPSQAAHTQHLTSITAPWPAAPPAGHPEWT